MRLVLGSLLGAAALSLSCVGAAGAAVFISSTAGAPDPGPLANETQVIDFDSGLAAGVSLIGDAAIVVGSLANMYAAPAGDTTPYLVTPFSSPNNAAELDFATFLNDQDVANFSFYWGSIDAFNTIQLLDRSGNAFFTIAGSMLPPANGNQVLGLTNRRVEFTLTGAERNLGGILFTSTKRGFEIDTLAFNLLSAIPEPASWSLMLAGFVGMGATLRARRRLAYAR